VNEWSKRVLEHPVWSYLSGLGSALDQAGQRNGIDGLTLESIERLRAVLTFTGKRLAGADPLVTQPHQLDQIAAGLQSAATEVQAFVTSGAVNHLANANASADGFLTHLAAVNVPITPDDTGALRDAATAYRATLGQQLDLVRAAMATFSTEHESLRARLTELTDSVSSEKTRAATILSEFQAQFSTAQDSRSREYSDAQNSRQEKFTSLLAEYATRLADQNATFAMARDAFEKTAAESVRALADDQLAGGNAVLLHIQSRKDEVEKLVGVIGTLGIASGFKKAADHARWTTWIWQGVTLLALFALVYFAYHAFLPAMEGAFSWQGLVARALLTLTIGVLAAYGARQGDKYLEMERRNRRQALEFEAIGPYLAPLPDEKQHEFRIAVGHSSFGRGESTAELTKSPATVVDVLSPEVQKIVAQTIKAVQSIKS